MSKLPRRRARPPRQVDWIFVVLVTTLVVGAGVLTGLLLSEWIYS